MASLKVGERVICMHMPRTYGDRLEVGREYVISKLYKDGLWVSVNGYGDITYEAKYFRRSSESKQRIFRMLIKNGHQYRVRGTDEAMKELAEIIGDDHLELIEPITRVSKTGKKVS